jgi:hypothetical protein
MDLLDKKGFIYGDKMGQVMVGELCGCDNMVRFPICSGFTAIPMLLA